MPVCSQIDLPYQRVALGPSRGCKRYGRKSMNLSADTVKGGWSGLFSTAAEGNSRTTN